MPLEELKARAAQEAAKQAGAAAAYCTLPCCLLGCTVTPQYASAIATYKCTTLPAVQKQRKAARKKRQIIESDEEEEEQVSKGVYLGPWTLHPLASHLGRTRSWLPPLVSARTLHPASSSTPRSHPCCRRPWRPRPRPRPPRPRSR